ncbi:MAG: ATP-binding cassette domain-containing protein [Flavobacteriales bacterium]|nr:ATP-binding cassette domain-containing protein [Flavobacteriales bacterium]
MTTLLETKDLTKKFGRLTAVNGLNLSVGEGQVFGMLGPNGSGKTTTLGMLLGVTVPTSGSFTWFGQSGDHRVRKKIGAILERPVFYPYMSAFENLTLVCKIKEVPVSRIDAVLRKVSLDHRKHDAFKTYSLGMKQRLAIASALLCDPQILILDEPTNGLDPQGIAEIRDLIRVIAGEGKTIILASHLLDEVQKVCTDFCVLNKGKLLYTGNVARDLDNSNLYELMSEDREQLERIANQHPAIFKEVNFRGALFAVRVQDGVTAADINRLCMQQGVVLNHLASGKKSLEEKFLHILEESNEKADRH